MIVKTANQKYTYNKSYCGQTLSSWIIDVHKHLSEERGWKYYPLKVGAYGYDNLAHSLSWIFLKCDGSESIEKIAHYSHKGWCKNYVYWRDNEPWTKDTRYYKPGGKIELGDERRNLCAKLNFSELSKEEQEQDLIIAKYIKKYLQNS